MQEPFQSVIDELDLEAAVRRGTTRNDLLPPRYEDSVTGEVGKRFLDGLWNRMERGRYDPTPASFVLIPKRGNTTRPAALLTLPDRVVFDALVESLRSRIESALLGPEIVMWPRGTRAAKRWPDFEEAPLTTDKPYIAKADIAGFYECIDHEILRDALIDMTGRREMVNALIEFLRRVMKDRRGLPQGLAPSDPIATAYLSSIDYEMARTGIDYFRHGDDVRFSTDADWKARKAIYEFEQALRKRRLLTNSSKSFVIQSDTYRGTLDERNAIVDETRKALLEARIAKLEKGDSEEITHLLEKTDKKELVWAVFYHNSVSFDDLITSLENEIEADDIEVASDVFESAMKQSPGSPDGLSKESFHHRITLSLVRLAAVRNPSALPMLPTLLKDSPEKTELTVQYLLALGDDHAEAVITVIREAMTRRFVTDWELAWLLRGFGRYFHALQAEDLSFAAEVATREDLAPICRVEALKVLGMKGSLEDTVIKRLWNLLPPCYRPDLVGAVYYCLDHAEWCDSFLAAVMEDPVNVVVRRHLDATAVATP